MNNKPEIRINIRATQKEKTELKKLALSTGIPQAVIVREALKDKIAELTTRIQNGEKVSLGVVSR